MTLRNVSPEQRKTDQEQHRLWERGEGGARLDWSGCYLDGASLDGASLRNASLDGASLRNASLRNASLDGANLKNTFIFEIGPLGSRHARLCVEFGKETRCKTGCFEGTLGELEEAVAQTHGENKYAQQYRAAIAFIRALEAINAGEKKAENVVK